MTIPGYGTYALREVDPKEVEALSKQWDELTSNVGASGVFRDEASRQRILQHYALFPNKVASQWTKEDLANAQAALGGLRRELLFSSGDTARLRAQQDEMAVRQMEKDIPLLLGYKGANFVQGLTSLADKAEELQKRGTPLPITITSLLDEIRGLQQAWDAGDKKRVSLLSGLIRSALSPPEKPGEVRREYEKLLGQMPQWASLPQAAQQAYLNRLRQLATLVGVDPNLIPNRIDSLALKFKEKQLAALERYRERSLAEQRAERQRRERADAIRLQLGLASQRLRERQFELEKRNTAIREMAARRGLLGFTDVEEQRINDLENKRKELQDRNAALNDEFLADLMPDAQNKVRAAIKKNQAGINEINRKLERIYQQAEKRAGVFMRQQGTATPKAPRATVQEQPLTNAQRLKLIEKLVNRGLPRWRAEKMVAREHQRRLQGAR